MTFEEFWNGTEAMIAVLTRYDDVKELARSAFEAGQRSAPTSEVRELREARKGRDAWIEAERRARGEAYERCAEHLMRVSPFGPEGRAQMLGAAAVFRVWAAEARALLAGQARPPGGGGE